MAKSNKAESANREIRVLSIQQPAADSIFWFGKWCENRDWTTKYRGELFIHASKVSSGATLTAEILGNAHPGGCRTGAIIGKVDIVDCVPIEEMAEIRCGKTPTGRKELVNWLSRFPKWSWQHVSGDECWILDNPRPLKNPIEIGGKLNIWKYTVRADQLQFHSVPSQADPKAILDAYVKCDPNDPLVKIAKKAILLSETSRKLRFRTKLGVVDISAAEYRLTEDYVSLVTKALRELSTTEETKTR